MRYSIWNPSQGRWGVIRNSDGQLFDVQFSPGRVNFNQVSIQSVSSIDDCAEIYQVISLFSESQNECGTCAHEIEVTS